MLDRLRASALLTAALWLGACGAHLQPLDEMPAGNNHEGRRAYLESHPDLEPATYQAIYDGRLQAGLNEEQVMLLISEPSSRNDWEGLYDEEWSYFTERDTSWVFFKRGVVSEVDGTAPIYRFPEIQRKRVVLRFVLPQRQTMVVSLYDAQRRLLGELLHGTLEPGDHQLALKMLEPKNDPLPLRPPGALRAGRHEVRWNARDAEDNPLPDGLYFLGLESIDRNEIRRFSLVQ